MKLHIRGFPGDIWVTFHFSKNGVLGLGCEPSMCGGQARKHMARDIENGSDGAKSTFAESEAILQ